MSTSISDDLRQQIAEANTRVEACSVAINYASPNYMDKAIYDLVAAEKHLSALLREARGETKVGGM